MVLSKIIFVLYLASSTLAVPFITRLFYAEHGQDAETLALDLYSSPITIGSNNVSCTPNFDSSIIILEGSPSEVKGATQTGIKYKLDERILDVYLVNATWFRTVYPRPHDNSVVYIDPTKLAIEAVFLEDMPCQIGLAPSLGKDSAASFLTSAISAFGIGKKTVLYDNQVIIIGKPQLTNYAERNFQGLSALNGHKFRSKQYEWEQSINLVPQSGHMFIDAKVLKPLKTKSFRLTLRFDNSDTSYLPMKLADELYGKYPGIKRYLVDGESVYMWDSCAMESAVPFLHQKITFTLGDKVTYTSWAFNQLADGSCSSAFHGIKSDHAIISTPSKDIWHSYLFDYTQKKLFFSRQTNAGQ